MTRPSSVPLWATDTNYTGGPAVGTPTKTAPSVGLKAQGWDPADEPGAQNFNYQLNLLGQWADWLNSIALVKSGEQKLTGSGTYTPTPGTLAVKVKGVGGGAGGGGVSANSANFMASGGGGSGVYWEKWIFPGSGVAVTGGAFVSGAAGIAGHGAGISTTNGGDGGDSTIVIQGVTYTVKGGSGGVGPSGGGGAFTTFAGGSPKTGSSAGDFASGDNGGPGIIAGSNGALGGGGGGGRWGVGGAPVANFGIAHGVAGNPGVGPGAGGSGAFTDTTGGDRDGGAGVAGQWIIEEFC